nr:MAG TPA: deaminase [Caudoviricetes sp.]
MFKVYPHSSYNRKTATSKGTEDHPCGSCSFVLITQFPT